MRARSVVTGVGVAIGTLIIAGGLAAEFAGGKPAAARHPAGAQVPPSTKSTTTSSLPPPGWHAVVPATTVPPDTPVQQQYDKGFEKGFSSKNNVSMMSAAEALPLSPPAVTGGWPLLHASGTPELWATQFVSGLLDIDFAHQSREALGAWLVAEEAPDLMPGIPAGFEDRTLYVSVLDPAITSEPSPVPSAGQWAADASNGVRWTVSDLEVQPDPQWQQMIDAGWQPPDIRSVVEDVSGVLTTREHDSRVASRFSIVIQVGSARWHDGYGSVLVSGWRDL